MEREKTSSGLWKKLRQNQAASWSLVFILIVGLGGFLAPLVSPY
ncbi:MAG: hypothetical protein ACE5E2_05965, partial [Candidatus Binatia bacterium]